MSPLGVGSVALAQTPSAQRKELTVNPKVLDAQQWANATYVTVPGYHRCDETGRTGWDTTFSLTHALQHELGIQTSSTNFGLTTLSLLAAKGDVKPGFANTNIIRTLRAARFGSLPCHVCTASLDVRTSPARGNR